jgi:hypothetical protein
MCPLLLRPILQRAGRFANTVSSRVALFALHDGEGAVWFAGGADGDLDVLTGGSEEFHEVSDGEVAGAVAHEKKSQSPSIQGKR